MPSTIVDREEALCLVGEKIKSLCHEFQPDEKHFLNFYGVPGIGKTALLKYLHKWYSVSHDNCVPSSSAETRPRDKPGVEPCAVSHGALPCAYIDFCAHPYPEPRQGYVSLLEDIITRIGDSFSQSLPGKTALFSEYVDAYRKNTQRVKRADKDQFNVEAEAVDVTDQFRIVMGDLVRQHKVVLLFLDHIEEAEPDVLELFEREILKELRKVWGLLVVMAKRGPMEWHYGPALRSYSQQYQLTLFPVQATQKQTEPELATAATAVQALTAGLPYANEWLKEQWNQERLHITPEQWIAQNDSTISAKLAHEIVYEYILKGHEQEIQEAFLKTSVVRQFETNMLYCLLQANHYPYSLSPTRALYYLELMSKMQKTGLLTWDSEIKGWLMEPAVRRILAAFLRLNHSTAFAGLHKVALDKYQEWFNGVPDDRHLFAIERLYHEACLIVHRQPNVTPREVAYKLRDLLRTCLSAQGAMINTRQLKNRMENDAELGAMVNLETLTEILEERIHV